MSKRQAENEIPTTGEPIGDQCQKKRRRREKDLENERRTSTPFRFSEQHPRQTETEKNISDEKAQ